MWLAVLIPLRDVLLAGLLALLRQHGYGPLPVHFLGKAATFCLLYAFPLLFLGDGTGSLAAVAKVVGWAFAIWGTGLYWWAGVLYGFQAHQLIRHGRSTRAGAAGPAPHLRGGHAGQPRGWVATRRLAG